MQPSDGEKVDRAGLLKRLLNVLWGFVPNAQHDSANKTFYLGRIIQATAQGVLHPFSRRLCSTQNRIAAAVPDQRSVFRITGEKHSTNIMPRKIRAHVELAGVSWRCDRLGGSKQLQF